MYNKYFKRFLDFIIALAILTMTIPIWIGVSLLLGIANNGKIFFTQQRIGKNNRSFFVMKFRSMNDKKDNDGNLLKDIDRLTPIGKLVRKTSLDELPQLINIIKGEMSLIGPRPLLPEYLPYYSKKHIRRHNVRPGITGLAQVKGRNSLTFGQRFDYDVKYVDNLSFSLDLTIFVQTIAKVLRPRQDIQLGVRPMSEIDDVGITRGLSKHYFNVDEPKK